MSRNSYKSKTPIRKLEFSINNFKSITSEVFMKLKPITIYCGVNSSGKSSILQSQLLISQSYSRDKPRYVIEKKQIPQIFIFEGHHCHLQDFRNIVFENNINNELIFKWKFKRNGRIILNEINCSYIKDEDYFTKGYPLVKKIKTEIIEDDRSKFVNFSLNEKQIPYYDVSFTNLELDAKEFSSKRVKIPKFLIKDKKAFNSFVESIFDEIYIVDAKNKITEIKIKKIKVSFQSIFPQSLDIYEYLKEKSDFKKKFDDLLNIDEKRIGSIREFSVEDVKRFIARDIFDFFSYFINHTIDDCYYPLNNFYEKIKYLGPLREEPKRFYSFTDLGLLDLGLKGENTTQVLTIQKDVQIDFLKLQNLNNQIGFSDVSKKSLLDTLNEWLEIMNLQQIRPKLEMELITKILVDYSKNQPPDSPVSIPDVGFGLSQILPVLVKTLMMQKDETLILEQPEIHLHPRMQGDLADFLLCNAYLGKKFIIETHSEHLIKRLCLRIAQFKDIDLSKLISVYFIIPNQINGGSDIIDVKINEFGRILNWPKGFFDENEDGKLLEESYKKKQYKNHTNKE